MTCRKHLSKYDETAYGILMGIELRLFQPLLRYGVNILTENEELMRLFKENASSHITCFNIVNVIRSYTGTLVNLRLS